MSNTILVTGGSGLVGRAIQRVLHGSPEKNCRFIFVSSRDCDLRNKGSTLELFRRYRPTRVLHLAGMVGGLFANQANNFDFLTENTCLNASVVQACHAFGITHAVFLLSTCIFPADTCGDTLDPTQLHRGSPHSSNYGYAHAKRWLEIAARAHNERYPDQLYECVIPTNLFGPDDHFNTSKSHVVPAIVSQYTEAARSGATVTLRGTGSALRQFVYVDDLARILVAMMVSPPKCRPVPMVVTGPANNEISIRGIAHIIASSVGYDASKVVFTGDSTEDGQHRKYISDTSGYTSWMPIEEAIATTIQGYEAANPRERTKKKLFSL